MRRFTTFEPSFVDWAGFAEYAPHFGGRKNRTSQAQKAGLRYERKAQGYMLELHPDQYVASPWIVFRLKGEPLLRWCQPDGILVDIAQARLTIVEIKLRHMVEAYVQVTGIYEPVLRKLFPGWQFRHLEVTRFYDPDTHFPVPVQLVSTPELTPHGRFGVHIWK